MFVKSRPAVALDLFPGVPDPELDRAHIGFAVTVRRYGETGALEFTKRLLGLSARACARQTSEHRAGHETRAT